MSTLRRGYTTGVSAALAFGRALEAWCVSGERAQTVTEKMDNDDLDVTKGCLIVAAVSDRLEDLMRNPREHSPYVIGKLRLYAGEGVGVVTRAGLKPPVGYPAINPRPLEAIEAQYARFADRIDRELYATIGIEDGETIARYTANAKVGVLGGLSILGTTGWVKPISHEAYLDSIRAEVAVIAADGIDTAVLTLGNASLAYAKERFEAVQIVEVGNYVYDALFIVAQSGLKRAVFVCGIGKGVKVMQGFRNTHNRFGSIDFGVLCKEIEAEWGIRISEEPSGGLDSSGSRERKRPFQGLGAPLSPSSPPESHSRSRVATVVEEKRFRTVKGLLTELGEYREVFHQWVERRAAEVMRRWFPDLEIEIQIVR